MRHLLVVDDEPNLVDGLCHALAEALGDDVDISKAYSGGEALDILSKNPVSLVITDVRMPDINGLDLLQAIHKRRISCRVLIITGYDEFNVIHEAVKLPFTDGFLLKNEGDEEIVKAVKKSLIGIEEAEKTQLALALADRQSQTLDILLRERRLWHILGMLPYYDESAALSETTLAIDLSKPLILVVVRSFSAYISADTIIWLEQQVNSLFSANFTMEVSILGSTDMVWLMQERADAAIKYPNDKSRSLALRAGMLEIQSRLANNGTELSVALSSKGIMSQDLSGYLHAFRNVLQNLSISGRHQQVIDLSADEEGLLAALLESASNYVSGGRYIHRAKNALLKGDEKEWESAMVGASSIQALDPSVITQLVSMFINTNDALGLTPVTDIPKLFSPTEGYASLLAAGAAVCRKRKAVSKHAITDVIARVHETIEKNLGNPTLSVTSIAMETHYNPSYLSRLYKQQTGINITEAINDVRIRRACELLKDTAIRISEISHRVGYASPSYFTFFFRKRMGKTPKEFRVEGY